MYTLKQTTSRASRTSYNTRQLKDSTWSRRDVNIKGLSCHVLNHLCLFYQRSFAFNLNNLSTTYDFRSIYLSNSVFRMMFVWHVRMNFGKWSPAIVERNKTAEERHRIRGVLNRRCHVVTRDRETQLLTSTRDQQPRVSRDLEWRL